MAGRRSAGLLLYRKESGELQVLLAHPGGPFWARKDEHAWSIPKGEYADDEDALAAARREFAEELGSPAPEGGYQPLGEVRQSGGKTVTAWAVEGDFDPATVRSNTVELQWPPRSGRVLTVPEVDRVEWFDLATARVRLIVAQTAFLDRLRG